MIDSKELILELAEFIRGNRGDHDGYLESFFVRKGGSGYCCLDALDMHARMKLWELREHRINHGEPRKKRTINVYGDAHLVPHRAAGCFVAKSHGKTIGYVQAFKDGTAAYWVHPMEKGTYAKTPGAAYLILKSKQ